MATVKSDQITNITAEPRVLLTPNEEGRLYRAYFSYTFAGTESALDVIEFTRLAKGVRVLGGRIIHTDLGTDVDLAIGHRLVDGTGGDTDAFTATSLDLAAAAGSQLFGNLVAADFGVEIPADSYLVGLLEDGGSYSASAGTIEGFVEYLLGE